MQWHTPIGYVVRDGKIIIEEEQAETVRQIFEDYERGASAWKIASDLTKAEKTNGKGRVYWSHASVGNILENHNYLGTEDYPQLIEQELFARVQKRREQMRITKGKGKYRPGEQTRLLFSGMLECGECGSVYSHFQAQKEKKNAVSKWKCKNYIFQNRLGCSGGFITDEEVERVAVSAINQAIKNPRLIAKCEEKLQKLCPEYRLLDRMFVQMKEEKKDNQELLFARASARYKTLEVRDAYIRSKEMMDMIEDREEVAELDQELLKALIRKILIYKDNTAKVILQNNNVISMQY